MGVEQLLQALEAATSYGQIFEAYESLFCHLVSGALRPARVRAILRFAMERLRRQDEAALRSMEADVAATRAFLAFLISLGSSRSQPP